MRSLLRNLLFRTRLDRELQAEVQSYIELLTDEKIRMGMTPDEARRQAHIEAGTATHITEEVRGQRSGASIETTLRDLRYGVRQLRRSPGFALIAVMTIALGIGANSAIFSVINGVVRKPLAYPVSEDLMFITSQFPTMGFEKFWVSPPEYLEFRENVKSFDEVGAYAVSAVNVSDGDQPERVPAVFITASMWDVLDVTPALGRTFTEEHDIPDAEPVVVLSHELWTRSFGSDPGVIGRRVEIQGLQRTVLGVMPPGFDLHDARAQIWAPLGLNPANRQNRGNHYLYLVGRLAPGVTQAQANAELGNMLRTWREMSGIAGHQPNDSTHRIQMVPLRDDVIGNVKRALWVLQGAVLLVLLIASANVANLLLARAETRHKEFAVRSALGAGRGRILRQFMAEGVVLSVIGGVLGLAIAHWGLQALLAANPQSIPRSAEITLDPSVLGFTFVVAVATGVVFGLAPLLHMGDATVTQAIKEGGVRTTVNAGRNRVRRGLVVAEVALAVMLVIGAGLLIRSFDALTSVDAGFNPEHRVTFGLVLPAASYQEPERRAAFHRDLQRRLEQIPGVERASAMSGLPPFRQVNANDTDFEDFTTPGPEGPFENVDYYQTVSGDYFETMGIQLVDGRYFNEGDAIGGPVVIVNEALVKRFYPEMNPIGKRLAPSISQEDIWFTVVGVVQDVKQGGLDQPAGTELYFYYDQMPRIANQGPTQMNVVIQSTRPLEALAPGIRQAVREMDPGLPIVQLRTMEEVIGASVSRQRFLSLLLGIFAVVALTLAAIGTYGILSYMVTERQREIGIRMALGADGRRVVGLVVGQGVAIAGIGIVLGVGGAFALSRVTASLLYGVSPSDPATYGAVATVIAVVAIAACAIPARRAMRVDPLEAMRTE